jgi:hypothetical protein
MSVIACKARDEGMRRVAEADPAFQQEAYHYLRFYARRHAEFIAEEGTEAASAMGLVPHDGKAWGPVFSRASREGLIRQIGYGRSLRRHLSPTVLWRSRMYRDKDL